MRWKGRRVSTNLEDRRGGGGAKAGGISILGLIVAFVAWKFWCRSAAGLSGNKTGNRRRAGKASAWKIQRPSSKKPQILSGLFLLIPKTPGRQFFRSRGKIIPLLNWSCSVAWLIHVVVLHRRQWGHFIVQLTKSLYRYQFL